MTEQTTTAEPAGAETPAGSAVSETAKPQGISLWRYIAIRFVLIIPTVLILVTLVFILMRMTGDPITAALGGRLTPDQLAERIHEAGYDRPLIWQYLDYLGGVFTGDFGTALSDGRPVVEMLGQFGTATLELTAYALVVSFIVGIPLGMIAAHRRDSLPDAVLRIFAILCYATPVFFFGLLLKLIFAVYLDVLPVSGRVTTGSEVALSDLVSPSGINFIDALRLGNTEVLADVVSHAVLPALALGLLTAGVFLRLVRTNMIGTLSMDYVSAARSRGVRERRLISKHAFRPALIPIITVMGMQIAMLLAGAVLTETTFEWKGLGFMLAQYLVARDFVAVQGIVIMLAVIVAVTNFIVDIVAALIDPRVRY
ncbi:MAG: ABC transporter permease [Bowdeniella nasicola]|nr:ABC transporter permease [Bowdeniella nasicola]